MSILRDMKMTKTSSSSLLWFAAILIVISVIAMSPALSFALLCLATASAATTLIFGDKKCRIIGISILIISITLATVAYEGYKKELEIMETRQGQE